MENVILGLVKPDAISFANEVISFILREGEFDVFEIRHIKIDEDRASLLIPSTSKWFDGVGEKVAKNCIQNGIDIRSAFGCDVDTMGLGKMVWGWSVKYITRDTTCLILMHGDIEEAKKFKTFAGRTDETDLSKIRGAFRHKSDSSIKTSTEEKRSFENIIHVPDPDRLEEELSILMSIKPLSMFIANQNRITTKKTYFKF